MTTVKTGENGQLSVRTEGGILETTENERNEKTKPDKN